MTDEKELCRKISPIVWLLLLAAVGALVLVQVAGSQGFQLGPFDVEGRVSFMLPGKTQLAIPPVGTITAATHRSPLGLVFTLTNIRWENLKEVLRAPVGQPELEALLRKKALAVFQVLALRLLVLGFLGGVLGTLFIPGRNRRRALLGGFTGFFVILVLLLSALVTYNTNAFHDPTFDGIIQAAPWMMGLVDQGMAKVRALGEQLTLLSKNLYRLFERLDNLTPLGVEGDIRVLIISDLHNNPAAFDFVEQTARSFRADFVIDAGDVTDYGTPLEAELLTRLKNLNIPYLITPGNHDSPQVVAKLRTIKNVTVLDKEIVEVAGVYVAGIPDPSSKSQMMATAPRAVADQYVSQLWKLITESAQKPHILVAHDPRIARPFIGVVPTVIYGHTHNLLIEERNGSAVINPGTTGAAGIRGLTTNEEISYTLTLLHLNKTAEGYQPAAVDVVRVFNQKSGFTIERELFTEGLHRTMEKEREDAYE